MSSVVISGDTSGAITLAAPAVSGTNTATLPAATGTVMVSGNMPAFSYSPNVGTSIADGTWTKVLYQSKNFDTNNNFSSSRFTPTIAGYYLITANARQGPFQGANIQLALYTNGALSCLAGANSYSASGFVTPTVSTIVSLNGSTDYVEIYAYQNSGTGAKTTDAATYYAFTGCLIRTA
jgi:hypothetical protein